MTCTGRHTYTNIEHVGTYGEDTPVKAEVGARYATCKHVVRPSDEAWREATTGICQRLVVIPAGQPVILAEICCGDDESHARDAVKTIDDVVAGF